MKYVDEYIDYISESEKNKFSTETKAGLIRIATAIVDKYTNRFKEINSNYDKVLQFLEKNKKRDFESRPMEVKYSDYIFVENGPKHNEIVTLRSADDFIKFRRKIKKNISNNESIMKYLPIYIRRVKRTGILVPLNKFLQSMPGQNSYMKIYMTHFLKGTK